MLCNRQKPEQSSESDNAPASEDLNGLKIENTSFNETARWPGFDEIKNLFVFGDSYSAIGFAANLPPPQKIGRKTVPYKGLTYADVDGTNWVGYLLTRHNPHPELLVHDYAVGGARVPALGRGGAVETQVEKNFLEGYAMAATAEGLLWDPSTSLFITWVGINDCAYAETHEDTLELLFTLEEKLYLAGARIFLFIDVPPIGRSPAGVNASSDISVTYTNWNSGLRRSVQKFATAHPDARILTFSAFDTFTRVLDNPKAHRFPAKDANRAGGAIWRDHLHPTSAVHKIFAQDLVAFLKSLDPRTE
ncbi:SGNH hydrolase-type esterase domain-containing protein [Mycena metata]|uniref:SGNH hydrolase-type esterase domain-containing protein n=1 Tax=Mycena metata TaxID=1033252 RepID=A0AAD7NPT5_9AGAR|nr:SGNH hydrolase-type esterase domain-containing protein [Mycena metata]